jgi:hypothetical protein
MNLAVPPRLRSTHTLLRELAPSLPIADRVLALSEQVSAHQVFRSLDSVADVQIFMEHHVWAVWDFMSLLKSIQSVVAPVTVPWRPPRDAAAARFINEIAAGEEGDDGPGGVPESHFAIYLEAMREVGADIGPITRFLGEMDFGFSWEAALEIARPPAAAADFVRSTLYLCERPLHERVAAFTLGREEVIPSMFRPIVTHLAQASNQHDFLKSFIWYLERHLTVDGDHHGPLAAALLEQTCLRTTAQRDESLTAAEGALQVRIALWDAALASMRRDTGPLQSAAG